MPQHKPRQEKKRREARLDKAVDMSFPASDATAHGQPTATEKPARPPNRKAPRISKEQIEQARQGEGHKHQR